MVASKEANSDSFTMKEEDPRMSEECFDNKQIFDNTFIKSNFCPIKFNRNDIKNLSSDFADQTLGGHREYREELINGRLAKVYVYTIKIIKYENENVEITRKQAEDVTNPMIIVENNLIVPFNDELALNRDISINNSPMLSPSDGMLTGKRGRPRKYPVGKEPYKARKRMANNLIDEMPEISTNSGLYTRRGDMAMFDFNNGYLNTENNQKYSDFNRVPTPSESPMLQKKRNVSDFLEDYLSAGNTENHQKRSNTQGSNEETRLFKFY